MSINLGEDYYYLDYVQIHLKNLLPRLVSYERLVTVMKSVIVPLGFFLQTLKGEETGIYFVSSPWQPSTLNNEHKQKR